MSPLGVLMRRQKAVEQSMEDRRDNNQGSQCKNSTFRNPDKAPKVYPQKSMLDHPISFLAMSLISPFKKDNGSGHAN